MSQRSSTRQVDAATRMMMGTKQELQERWKHLELKPATLLHLQELLDRRGVTAAVTVTNVLAREKKPKMADIGMEWSFEELRLISLEGIRPHLVDLIRVALESFMAWHFIHVPESALGGMVEIVLAVLFCVVGVGAICFTCRCRSKKQTPRSRNKRPSMMARFEGVLRISRLRKS
ncbi:hypothetical protein ccbrp13_20350 [Ktedonobacteria bacterium brp13]|nr:hypothetical protein ccbrp13_20350 [Ktedonobacteria bacterium brp13]